MDKTYLERVKGIVTINEPHLNAEEKIWDILDTSKALTFDGHFKLLSGNHSDTFFRFDAITLFPYLVSMISKEMLQWLYSANLPLKIDVVLGPASHGMFFAYDMARELNRQATKENRDMNTRAVYTAVDEENGYPLGFCLDGFEINPRENVLVVNDMTTTGNGIETLINLAERNRAKVLGVCLFANRGNNEKKIDRIKSKYLFHSIIDLKMPYWPAKDCHRNCKTDKRLVKAEEINHLPIYSEENAYDLYVKKLLSVA
ncbi:orotate phosphoribosyltransferase [Candidatus Magnetobacterium bavaricum]|uniref:Orotate phosphoribosyltransferase n=1 Tax=Candidatus Magnetobacterium bavaricum TaxID=29290 RepID=A0A0F3GYW5_9BACT|nr:orotate phosphoribosyltransferase [Candidatus Magnetobacterium bavaricum]